MNEFPWRASKPEMDREFPWKPVAPTRFADLIRKVLRECGDVVAANLKANNVLFERLKK